MRIFSKMNYQELKRNSFSVCLPIFLCLSLSFSCDLFFRRFFCAMASSFQNTRARQSLAKSPKKWRQQVIVTIQIITAIYVFLF